MSLQGKIIEYLENDKFICGFALANSGKRLHLLNQKGRDVNLPLTRIIHYTQNSFPLNSTRDEILKHLQAVSEKRRLLMDQIDAEEVWSLVSGETDSVFRPDFLAELCFGKDTKDDHIASFLRMVFKDRLFFKYKEGEIIVHSPEVVERLRIQKEKQRKKEEFLSKGADALIKLWQDAEPARWPLLDDCLQLVRDYYLFGNEAPKSDIARELLKKAQLNKPGDSFHLLVKAGIWDKNENIPLLRKNIRVAFSEATTAHAATLVEADPEILLNEGRKDLRSLALLTIDGEETRDFDDALHLEKQNDNYLVGIHISDVTRYVKVDDPLFEEAMARGTSIYLPEGPIPMLPKPVSEGLCSLIANKTRPAMSLMVLLSPEGEVLDYNIFSSVVKVRRQLSYQQANQLIGQDEELSILGRLSTKLRDRRLAAGALLLPFPDVNISIDKDGRVDVTLSDTETPSRVLISEFMILANSLAAEFIANREIPGLYRSQPPPRQRLIEGYEKDLFINVRQRKNLSPMTLSTKPKPHSGLGVTPYTTITSPIRRLLDLVMQHQIMHQLRGKGSLFTKKELMKMGDAIGNLLTRANAAKQLRHRYWILKFLEPRIGERFNGLVIDKGPRHIHVLLIDFILDADLPLGQAIDAEPGQLLSVKIAKADALNSILKIER